MEILDSARRHDVADEDMLHAVDHQGVLELIVHARLMRPKYRSSSNDEH